MHDRVYLIDDWEGMRSQAARSILTRCRIATTIEQLEEASAVHGTASHTESVSCDGWQEARGCKAMLKGGNRGFELLPIPNMSTNGQLAHNVDFTPLKPVQRDGKAEAVIFFDIGMS